jgi:signal transduction histidine kinase
MKLFYTFCMITLSAGIAAGPAPKLTPVEMDGVVKAVMQDDLDIDWYRVEFATPSNTINVAIAAKTAAYDALYRMIDAKVRVTGKMWLNTNRLHPKHNTLFATAPFKTLITPPSDPFAAEQFSSSRKTEHRQIYDGNVIATSTGKAYIRRKGRNPVEVLLAENVKAPPIGAKVTVAGFPVRASRRLIFRESLLRIDALPATSTIPEISDIDGEKLFSSPNGPSKVNPKFNGDIIRINGIVIAGYTDEIDSMLLKCGKRTIRVNMDFPGGYGNDITPGSTVEVTGMCLHDFDEHPLDTIIPRFRGIVILPRSANDIRILAAPSWWTPVRFAVITALLALIIVAVLIHNRILKALASRKGRELYDAQIDHAKAELKVEERTRLAVEIHDSMSQMLTGTALQIDAAMRIGDKGFDAAKGYLHNARQMLASCRHELRCCLWDLRSRTFEEKNMAEAVERTIANHLGQTASTVRFNVPREALSDNDAHVVLRIIRELTVNAIRHGHASYVKIAGELKDGFIKFSVRDDGCGFDPETANGPEQGHFGIQGIRERVAAINGSIDIRSVSGKGTRITVSIPAESGEK